MRCPRCGADTLDPTRYDAAGTCQCSCGHQVYAGYVAEADALEARLGWLTERVRAGDPAPDPVLAQQYAIWRPPPPAERSGAAPDAGTPPAGGPASPGEGPGQPAAGPARAFAPYGTHAPSATRPRRAVPAAATLLLGLGALLLVVAGAVFAAVVWDRLGAIGQVALMLGATFGIGALTIAIRSRLAGTAEALAVVAAGLAVIDVVAAPLLGLLPESWIQEPTLYPAGALGVIGLIQLGLHRRYQVRAWSWLGWAGVLSAAWLVLPAVATATQDQPNRNWVPAAVVVPTLTAVGMLAARHARALAAGHRAPLLVIGSCGVFFSALATAAAATSPSNRVGALITTAATALVVGVWAARDRGATTWLGLGAAALSGITAALVLALPADPQPVWLAVAVALAGIAVGLVLWLADAPAVTIGIGACAVWASWVALRVTGLPGPGVPADLISNQLSLLAGCVAVLALALAWWTPALAWAGALLGTVAAALAPISWGDTLEAFTLPVALLFLGAGLLWRRRGPTPSLQWLGPALSVALVPSAVGAWMAPWALNLGAETTSTHLVRLTVVLVGSSVLVVIGARLHLAGVLVPAASALVILTGAQIWSGLSSLPRWSALAIAGTLLVVAGARIEWLRDQGRAAASWADSLR